MFVPPRLPDYEANCILRKYDILMDRPLTGVREYCQPLWTILALFLRRYDIAVSDWWRKRSAH